MGKLRHKDLKYHSRSVSQPVLQSLPQPGFLIRDRARGHSRMDEIKLPSDCPELVLTACSHSLCVPKPRTSVLPLGHPLVPLDPFSSPSGRISDVIDLLWPQL